MTEGLIDNKAFYFEAHEHGKPAEGIIGGCLRGGFIHKGMFASHGPVGTFHVQPAGSTRELKVHEAGNE
jgi:hypothetical protein